MSVIAPVVAGQDPVVVEVIPLSTVLDAPDDPVVLPVIEPGTPVEPPVVPVVPVVTEPVTPVEPKEPEVPEEDRVETLRKLNWEMRQQLDLSNARLARQAADLEEVKKFITTPAPVQPAPVRDKDDDLLDALTGRQAPTPIPATAAPVPKLDTAPMTEIEVLHHSLAEIGQQRSASLVTLIEAMSFNPAFADVKQVCSRNNLNDIVEAIAPAVAAEDGIPVSVAALRIENAIWKMDNPYSWIYKAVKENHPKYAKAVVPAVPAPGTPPAEGAARTPKPVEAPASIGGVGGSDSAAGGGWTAAKLDAMDEMDLIKVPEHIRQAWYAGDLS